MGITNTRKYSNDTKIAVLCGGLSSEREVSLRSGKNVFEALKRLGYTNVELIDVDKNVAKTLIEKDIKVAYNALHGKYGEDGCIQGTLELLGIEYTGCGVFSSATCINKEYTKTVLKKFGLPLIKSVFVKLTNDKLQSAKELEFKFTSLKSISLRFKPEKSISLKFTSSSCSAFHSLNLSGFFLNNSTNSSLV